jgi:integrase
MATRLTERVVKTAPVPSITWDDTDKGFMLRVYSTGTRSFCLGYRVGYRERRLTIGNWPTWSVDAARERARELRRGVDIGRDPLAEKRERREAPTMQDLANRYLTEVLPTLNKHATAKRRLYRETDTRKILDEVVKKLGKHTPVASVHHGDIKVLHAHFTARGGPRANRILALVSKMFSLSLIPLAGEDKAWRSPVDGNPVKGIKRHDEEGRGKLYSPAQLAAISDALASYPGQRSADAVRLILLSGARPIEVLRSRWTEFDAEAGVWLRPSAHVKTKRPIAVPLCAPALELIDKLRRGRAQDEQLLFPGKGGGEMSTLQHVWSHVRRHAGLGEDCRLYDLRHSFATTGAQAGLSLPLIGRLLGHTKPSTTEKYARHLSSDPLKEAVDRIAAQIMPSRPAAEIVNVRKR